VRARVAGDFAGVDRSRWYQMCISLHATAIWRKSMSNKSWLAIALMIPFSFQLTANAKDDVDRKAIDNANAKLIALQKDGDAEGMGEMYTDDAILLPSGGSRTEGRAAIEAFWAKILSSGVEDVQLRTENLESLGGDLVYEIGSYTTTPADGAPIAGHYVVLWKRVDGEWKLHVDIFNEGTGN
jgi:uncharacterized protein (TIGR02246 family)